jgi:O-antigen ligase
VWWIFAAFAAAVPAALAGVPATVTATGLGLALLALMVRDPGLGVASVVLGSGFLLGEYKNPYFLFAHGLALAALATAWARSGSEPRAAAPVPYWPPVVFLVTTILAVPLDLRTLLEDLWLGRWLDWQAILWRGLPDAAPLKPLERVGTVAVGVGLFVVAARTARSPLPTRVVAPLAAVVGALGAFGLVRFFGLVRTSGDYLTLSFWTWEHPDLRLTAVAWNPDYLAQFLALSVPIVLTLAWRPGAAASRVFGGAAAILGAVALVFTFQRAGYLALTVALAVLAGLRVLGAADGRRARWRWVGAGAAGGFLLVAVVALVDHAYLGGRVAGRLSGFATDPNRLTLWEAALGMSGAHPLLGVGTGRYAFFFREYADPKAVVGFGPFWGTAHSTYLQLLAEQGILGLAAFAMCFGGVWLRALRGLGAVQAERRLVAEGLVAGFAGWFVYAALQYVFRVDGLLYLTFVLAGWLAGLTPPAAHPVRHRAARRIAWTAAAIGLALLVVRVEAALRRPVPPGYEAGFYRWERQPDGAGARWMGGRAAMTVRVDGPVLALSFRAPLPGVGARPQTVTVRVDGRPAASVRLATGDWHPVAVRVDRPARGHVLVELETAYTLVPARATASRDTRRLGVMVGPVVWRDA